MQVQRSTLSAEDIDIIRNWSRTYRTGAWFWSIGGLPVIAFSIWISGIFIREEMNIIPLLVVFGLLGLLFIGMFIKCYRKLRLVKKIILENEKNINYGTIQSLQTKGLRTLVYTIDGQRLAVTSSILPQNFVHASCMQGAPVRVHTVNLSASQQLLLQVQYEQVPPARRQVQLITAEEKAGNNNKKDSWDALKIAAIILGILCFGSSIFFRGAGLLLILSSYLFCFLLIGAITYFIYRTIESYTEKLVIEGTITEIVRIRYKIGKYSGYKQLNWYRVGHELTPGTMQENEGLQPGDTVRFEYYAGKNGQRRAIIRSKHTS
jgi:hypothetical protein